MGTMLNAKAEVWTGVPGPRWSVQVDCRQFREQWAAYAERMRQQALQQPLPRGWRVLLGAEAGGGDAAAHVGPPRGDHEDAPRLDACGGRVAAAPWPRTFRPALNSGADWDVGADVWTSADRQGSADVGCGVGAAAEGEGRQRHGLSDAAGDDTCSRLTE